MATQGDFLAARPAPKPKLKPEPASSPETVQAVPPTMLEFVPLMSGERWRVERFPELAAEFLLSGAWPAVMAQFHFMAQEHTRQWLMVRRLYGVAPLIPSPDAHPDDLRCWSRAELRERLGLSAAEVQAELDALRTLWQGHLKSEERAAEPETPTTAVVQADRGELALDDTLLERHQFSEEMFKAFVWDPKKKEEVERADRENRIERDWFAARVKQWEKMLMEPMAGEIARAALLNELYSRRLAVEMGRSAQGTTRYKDLSTLKKDYDKSYREQVDSLQVMFPEMAIAGKVSFRGVISDLSAAHRDYYGHHDRRLVDKVHTAAELEFLLRPSAQLPTPRYRFGLALAIVEAINGLYNADFRTQFKPHVLKQLDEGFRAGAEVARTVQRQPVVDLENGVTPGEGDDFEDYKT